MAEDYSIAELCESDASTFVLRSQCHLLNSLGNRSTFSGMPAMESLKY